jgi:hypothetical protein
MAANIQNWQFDCAMHMQVPFLYAALLEHGDEKFNAAFKSGDGYYMKISPLNSSGIDITKSYKRLGGGDENKFIEHDVEGNIINNTEIDAAELLSSLPVGSRVSIKTNTNDVNNFTNENVLKVGENLYSAHGVGKGLYSLEEIKKLFAPLSKGTYTEIEVQYYELKQPDK